MAFNFTGTSGRDIFTGSDENDTAYGLDGDDSLSGAGGSDILAGGLGADLLRGGAGNDYLYSGAVSPPFNLPYYNVPAIPPLLDRGIEVDTLQGGDGSDRIFAGYGDNVDGGTGGSFGDYLYISFQGASVGVTADFGLSTQTIGGGTITGIENISWIEGSNFDDNINARATGGGYADFAYVGGMGGNDRLLAGYYTGVLSGDDGDDVVDGRGSQYLQQVLGGLGNDILYTNTNTFGSADGGEGNDTIYSHGETRGGAGNDLIVLQATYYGGRVQGDAGDDEIRAAASGNQFSGGAGADLLIGGDAYDTIVSADFTFSYTAYDALNIDYGLEHDRLDGGAGNDILFAGYGDDVDGGAGSDRLTLSLLGATSGATLRTGIFTSRDGTTIGGGAIRGIETLNALVGTDFDDRLLASTAETRVAIYGMGGNDMLTSTDSSADLSGGDGDDLLISGIAGDLLDGGAGVDTLSYAAYGEAVRVQLLNAGTIIVGSSGGTGAGGDTLISIENVIGSRFDDELNGNEQANVLTGGDGADVIVGGDGNDRLAGGRGADAMTGGGGDDIFLVDDIGDVASEMAAGGYDTVQSTVDLALGDHVEKLVLTGRARVGTGNDLDNLILGADGADTLSGLFGNDSIQGNAGADQIDGGAGDDTLYGGLGRDVLTGGVGADRFVFRVGDSGATAASADRVTDFSHAQGDRISLAAIDANEVPPDTAFSFIGTAAFSGVAGQLRYGFFGGDTLIEGDTNGDGVGDLAIRLSGNVTLVAGDFVL